MKKVLLSIILILTVLISLTSCKWLNMIIPPKDADALHERIDEKMDDLDSLKATTNIHAKLWISGYQVTFDGEGTTVLIDEEYYYSYGETTIRCEEMDLDEKTISSMVYSDGKAYVRNEADGVVQRLVCPMSYDEFEDYLEYDEDDIDFDDFKECVNVDYRKDGKTWVLEYSGYKYETVQKISQSFDMEEITDAKIRDIKVKIVSDRAFNVTEMTIEFVFDVKEGENTPEFVLTFELSEHDAASRESFDDSGYTEVDDLLILKKLKGDLDAAKKSNNGSVYFSGVTTATMQGSTSKYKETDVVKYGEKNGKYFYNIEMDVNGTQMSLKYKDGVLTVSSGGETQQIAQTDEEARALIEQLFDQLQYDEAKVRHVEKLAEGSYKLSCHADKDYYQDSLGVSVYTADQVISVKYTEAEKRVESRVTISGGQGLSATITCTILLDYKG